MHFRSQIALKFIFHISECPVDALTCGPVAERFQSIENQAKLLNFLIGHMKCARLTALNRLQEDVPEVYYSLN